MVKFYIKILFQIVTREKREDGDRIEIQRFLLESSVRLPATFLRELVKRTPGTSHNEWMQWHVDKYYTRAMTDDNV